MDALVVARELAIAIVVAPLVVVGMLVTLPVQLLMRLIGRHPWSQTQPHAWLLAQWTAVLERPYLR